MAVLRTDSFSAAAGPLDSTWTQQLAQTVNYDGSGNAVPSGTGNDTFAFDNTNTYPNDQYAKITLGTLVVSSGAKVTTRASGTGATANCYRLATDGTSAKLWRVDNGAQTLLTTFTATLVAGDVLELWSAGSVHTAKQNGSSLGTWTDATYASGSVGLGSYNAGGGACLITDWEGGTIPILGGPTPGEDDGLMPYIVANEPSVVSVW